MTDNSARPSIALSNPERMLLEDDRVVRPYLHRDLASLPAYALARTFKKHYFVCKVASMLRVQPGSRRGPDEVSFKRMPGFRPRPPQEGADQFLEEVERAKRELEAMGQKPHLTKALRHLGIAKEKIPAVRVRVYRLLGKQQKSVRGDGT